MSVLIGYTLLSLLCAFAFLKWLKFTLADLNSFPLHQKILIIVLYWVCCPAYPVLAVLVLSSVVLRKLIEKH